MIRQPKRLKQRPQWRGMAVPYVTFIGEDGNPDFRVTDEAKRFAVMKYGLCQLCGDGLGKYKFFVGGTEAAKNNAYYEPACHLDCLIYAMQVCPFIVGKMEHADMEKIEKRHNTKMGTFAGGVMIKSDSSFAAVRNPYWVIKKATDWKYAQTGDGTILMLPNVVKETKPLHPESMSGSDWTDVYNLLVK